MRSETRLLPATCKPGDQLLAARLFPTTSWRRKSPTRCRSRPCSKQNGPSEAPSPRAISSASTSRSTRSSSTRPASVRYADATTAVEALIAPRSSDDGIAADEAPQRARARHRTSAGLEFQHVLVTNVQTINAPVSAEDEAEEQPARPGDGHTVRRHARPVAGAVGAVRVRNGVRPGLAVDRTGHRRRRRHPPCHARPTSTRW